MSVDSSKTTFRPVCFSTNFANFSSVSILRQYFMSSECLDINYKNDYHVTFRHKITFEQSGQIEIENTFYEISSFSKENEACKKADCFIIFFDLESNESIRELNKILKYITENCDKEKKIYLVTIYTNIENYKNFKEDNIKSNFSHNNLDYYNILSVNMDSSEELVKTIDSIAEETLKEKNNPNKNLGIDESISGCLII